MNYALAREIYGRTPLMVDKATFSTLFNLVNAFRSGIHLAESVDKLNNSYLYDIKSETRIITNTGQLGKATDAELVYVINLNGPIIKNGGSSSIGTKDLAQMIKSYDSDSRVKGGIIVTDSGGGSSSGMDVLVNAIEKSHKPIVSLVEFAGGAGSAAYGIIAATKWIFAESENSEVGSIGTMVSFEGYPNKAVGADGSKHVTIYATASTRKNDWFEEALNHDNYELAINEVLDPHNERFIQHIRNKRPNVTDSHLDGSVYRAGTVVGVLVDQIGNFDDAVAKVLELANTSILQTNSKNKLNNKTAMTAQEFQTENPEAYNSIFNAGVSAEKDRVGSWMAHASTDLESVKSGIDSGLPITATATQNFLVKSFSATNLANLKKDSSGDLLVGESIGAAAEVTADQKELNNIYGKFLNKSV